MPFLDIDGVDVEYSICPTKQSSYQVTGTRTESQFRTAATISQTYRVYFPDLATPSDLTDPQVACLPELPTVNITPYVNSNTGYTNPYAIARSKRVTRNTQNSNMWEVSVDFSYSELLGEECEAAPVENVTDIDPIWTFETGSFEEVIYSDQNPQGESTCYLLPTDTPFENPVTRKVPTIILTITQFEDTFDYGDAMARSFKCNGAIWLTEEIYAWMIGAVQFTEQEVLTTTGFVTAKKVVYKIALRKQEDVYDYNGSLQTVGHEHTQPLIDNRYLDSNGDLQIAVDPETNEVKMVLIDNNGENRNAGPNDLPWHQFYYPQATINFDDFLRARP